MLGTVASRDPEARASTSSQATFGSDNLVVLEERVGGRQLHSSVLGLQDARLVATTRKEVLEQR